MLLSDLDSLTQAVCLGLRQTYGVGVDNAATLLTAAGDYQERFRTMQGSRLSVSQSATSQLGEDESAPHCRSEAPLG